MHRCALSVCVPCTFNACRGQKTASEPWALELAGSRELLCAWGLRTSPCAMEEQECSRLPSHLFHPSIVYLKNWIKRTEV